MCDNEHSVRWAVHMLDLLLFRDGGDTHAVRESQRRRGADVGLVNEVIALDSAWRQAGHNAAKARGTAKKLAAAAAAHRRGAVPPSDDAPSPEAVVAARTEADVLDAAEAAAQRELTARISQIGNLVHEHAPLAAAAASSVTAGTAITAALERLFAAGLAEQPPSGGWRPAGLGQRAHDAMLARALHLAAARRYRRHAYPLLPSAERLDKLAKLMRQRGEVVGPRASCEGLSREPLGLHACTTLQPAELPLGYALVQPAEEAAEEAAGTGEVHEAVWVHEICADDGSCWDGFDAMAALVGEVHRELLGDPLLGDPGGDAAAGLNLVWEEVPTSQLGHAEARALVLRARCRRAAGSEERHGGDDDNGGSVDGVQLSRVACLADFAARRLGVRCGSKAMGERGAHHVHTLRAQLCSPPSCLLALSSALAAAEGSASGVDGGAAPTGACGARQALLEAVERICHLAARACASARDRTRVEQRRAQTQTDTEIFAQTAK